MQYDVFATLVRQLHEARQAEEAYLAPLPSQIQELLVANDLAESHYRQRQLLAAAAFGGNWPDVQWFLEEWRPGFCITVNAKTPQEHRYILDTLEDYLDYARRELFSGT